MPQTLLALLAITVVTLFALRQHEKTVHLQREIIRNEVTTQMMAVAVDHLEDIGRKAFDERTSNGKTIFSAASLTRQDSFILDNPDNDIDDFNEASIDTFRVSNSLNIWYRLETEVTYADPDDPNTAVNNKTKVKKATVKVYALPKAIDSTKWLGMSVPDTVTLSQSYSCGSWCDF